MVENHKKSSIIITNNNYYLDICKNSQKNINMYCKNSNKGILSISIFDTFSSYCWGVCTKYRIVEDGSLYTQDYL